MFFFSFCLFVCFVVFFFLVRRTSRMTYLSLYGKTTKNKNKDLFIVDYNKIVNISA